MHALAIAALTGSIGAASLTIDGPARTDRTAVRDVAWDPTARCDDTTVAALADHHPEVGQFVVVTAPDASSSVGTVEVAVRDRSGAWRCQVGPTPARLGRNGVRALDDRRSGDGTTPAGVFPLGTVTAWDGQTFQFFGNRPDPGVRGAYRAVRHEDCWGATPGDPNYQRLVARPGCPGPDDEWLPRYGDVYAHAAVIGANLDPVSGDEPGEPALAAAIFLHRHAYDGAGRDRPTSGCVSLPLAELVDVLGVIDPAREPRFAIGTVASLRAGG